MFYRAPTIVLLLCLIFTPADAARRRKPRAKGKGRAVRVVTVRESCPPCAQQTSCPDKVIVSAQDEQSATEAKRARLRQNFEREFAEWLARQPSMSPAAAGVLRETARVWFGKGIGEAVQK